MYISDNENARHYLMLSDVLVSFRSLLAHVVNILQISARRDLASLYNFEDTLSNVITRMVGKQKTRRFPE
jgi:hypothetical protein